MCEIIELFLQLLGTAFFVKETIDNNENMNNYYQKNSYEFKEPQINKKWETLGRVKIGKSKKSKKNS